MSVVVVLSYVMVDEVGIDSDDESSYCKKKKKVSAVLVDGFSINGDVSFSFLSDRERPPSHKTMTIVFPKIRLCLDISLEAKTVFFFFHGSRRATWPSSCG